MMNQKINFFIGIQIVWTSFAISQNIISNIKNMKPLPVDELKFF